MFLYIFFEKTIFEQHLNMLSTLFVYSY